MGLALAGMIPACSGNRPPNPNPLPTPVPTPVPTPTPAANSDALLRITPQLQLTNLKGEPVKLRGCVAYSVPGHDEINSLWPGASKQMMDFFAQYGCRAFEHRLGPFIANCDGEDDACGETLWFRAGIGGGYNPDGSINEKYGQAVEDAVAYGDSKGYYQGVILIDTWGCKVGDQGNPYNPWRTLAPQSLANCAVRGDAVQEAWVRYWVKRLTKYPHVYWQLDNEGDLVPHANQEWWNWLVMVIRDEEKKNGPNVHITFATPPFGSVAEALYTHDLGPVSVIDGKFTLKNEYNPDHYNPGETVSNISSADQAPSGVSLSFWQDDATDAQALATLDGMKAAFSGHAVGCYAPDGNDPLWQDPPTDPSARPAQMMAAFNAAKGVVGDRCGVQGQCTPAREPCAPPIFIGCIDTSDLIAIELRKQNYCASGAWGGGPEIALLAPDGWWEQYHPCATENGCYTGNPYKFAWKYKGQNPTPGPTPPPSTCTVPVPTVDEIRCKLHQANQGLYDCTPKAHGQPILPEGDPQRPPCELQAMGGPPNYVLSGAPPTLFLTPQENIMQFRIQGSGSGIVTCTVPAASGNLCRTQENTDGVHVSR